MNDLDDDGNSLDGAFGEGFFHARRFASDAAAVGAEALAAATDSLWVIGRRVALLETKTAASDKERFPASAVAGPGAPGRVRRRGRGVGGGGGGFRGGGRRGMRGDGGGGARAAAQGERRVVGTPRV
jgi:hypothetical protein